MVLMASAALLNFLEIIKFNNTLGLLKNSVHLLHPETFLELNGLLKLRSINQIDQTIRM
jgi:hypothetical protein